EDRVRDDLVARSNSLSGLLKRLDQEGVLEHWPGLEDPRLFDAFLRGVPVAPKRRYRDEVIPLDGGDEGTRRAPVIVGETPFHLTSVPLPVGVQTTFELESPAAVSEVALLLRGTMDPRIANAGQATIPEAVKVTLTWDRERGRAFMLDLVDGTAEDGSLVSLPDGQRANLLHVRPKLPPGSEAKLIRIGLESLVPELAVEWCGLACFTDSHARAQSLH